MPSLIWRAVMCILRACLCRKKPELGGAEILFTATQRMHRIAPGEEGRIETGIRFGEIFSSHFWLGIEHIVTGFDHLAFVFCLLLIGGTRRQSLLLITGFTIGHSLTLALAVLGVVRADPQMVEALIGFSIALGGRRTHFGTQSAHALDRHGGGGRIFCPVLYLHLHPERVRL
jgi:hypothetical protein